MKENLQEYIGLPYGWKDGQYNCLDLCRIFYKEHGYKQLFVDGKPFPPTLEEFNKNDRLRLMKYLLKNFDVSRDYSDARYGDIVMFDIRGDMHFGIYVDDDCVLAMQVPCIEGSSQSTIYRPKFWKPAFKYVFRRKL